MDFYSCFKLILRVFDFLVGESADLKSWVERGQGDGK